MAAETNRTKGNYNVKDASEGGIFDLVGRPVYIQVDLDALSDNLKLHYDCMKDQPKTGNYGILPDTMLFNRSIIIRFQNGHDQLYQLHTLLLLPIYITLLCVLITSRLVAIVSFILNCHLQR